MKILALESSTSSAKAFLYDTESGQSVLKTKPYPAMYPDRSIHDADAVYRALLEVGREASAGCGDEIALISLGGTWHSLCLFDRQMEPQTPVYPWCYTGASAVCRTLRRDPAYTEDHYRRTGCMVNAIYPFYKLLMLKREGKALRGYRIGGQGVYNTFRMTGEFVATRCTASGTGLLDIRELRYDAALMEELGIEEEALPRLLSFEETFPLQAEAARALGVREGVPVIPSNADGGLNQIGVGAIREGVMTFSVGTSGALRLSTDAPVLPKDPSTWCYLSPKRWLSGAATSGACNCIDWFKKNFASGSTYQELEMEFTREADLPVFLPFLFGERCPGWRDERRGRFLRLKASHTVKELYRAVQEGVLFNLYQCYEELVRTAGRPQRIRFSGGILNSPVWSQMCADIFQEELEVDRQAQSSLMGGIVLGMERLGAIGRAEDFDSPPAAVIHPRPERQKAYRERYQRYLDCYRDEGSGKAGGKA